MIYPYRVFVSYSHEDAETARQVVRHLKLIRQRPIWDKDIAVGTPFTDQIKNGIAFAHAFIPIVTESSNRRPWVHQEIGYSMGVGVPTLPLAIGALPRGIIQGLHALVIKHDLSDLKKLLTIETIDHVVNEARDQSYAIFACAALPEERAAMLADYAEKVLDLRQYGKVRQCGALSSFCIPTEQVTNPVWDKREGKFFRTPFARGLQQKERLALEKHAQKCGCDLIISPSISFRQYGPGVRKARLETLRSFLAKMPDDKVRVVIQEEISSQNLLIIGDWFVAESISPRPTVGYFQTVATRHAPTVLNRVAEFDVKFEELLRKFIPNGGSSRKKAIAEIDKIIKSAKS